MAAGGKARRNANGQGGVYRRGDGRWEAKVFVDTPDGRRKRISVYGDSERAALDELGKVLDQQRRGIPTATTTLTVAEYMTYWLEHIAEPSVRRTTYATYEGDVRLHIIPGIGNRKLKSLQASHIRAWLTGLQTRCQCCAQGKDAARGRKSQARCCALVPAKCCNDALSASSIRHILRVLRAALQDAVDEEMLSRNVARLVQLRVTDDRKVRSFTRAEAMRFLKTAETTRLYALWAVALSMGLRRGEALGLQWSDVDLDAERITIRRALHRVDGQLKLENVKTEGSVAVLPVPRTLVPILTNHRRRQLEERLAAGSTWRDTGLVFTTPKGGALEPRNVNRMFHSLCAKAEVPQLRVHDLRHSCATLLFTMGVQPATVQKILRHSSITVTTGTYVEVIEAVQRDALDSMGSLFASNSLGDETG
ncbi:site-specific integrase [Mycobacteroides abscessus]|jgi:integrase|nr:MULTISPECIES: site-specific integrase [Mycobacteriaceae]APE19130.1 site-specific integrase [Mycobacterium sp. WY10]HNI68661.1 site-specific integrase [Nitrospira sp.]AKK30373.1 integrase [Mycobacterium sp. EPa45]MBB3753973.1 integrase [Mycolicibacterium sp. BK634]MCA4748516.1 site-specific integrase [Mycobacteroides abscessus]